MIHNALVRYTLSLLLMVCSTFVSAQNFELIGKWQDINHPEKTIEFYQQGSVYFGKSIPPEGKAPKVIFKDFRRTVTEGVYQGILIDPDGETEYKIQIQMTHKDLFRFSVSKFIFKKTFQFKRIK